MVRSAWRRCACLRCRTSSCARRLLGATLRAIRGDRADPARRSSAGGKTHPPLRILWPHRDRHLSWGVTIMRWTQLFGPGKYAREAQRTAAGRAAREHFSAGPLAVDRARLMVGAAARTRRRRTVPACCSSGSTDHGQRRIGSNLRDRQRRDGGARSRRCVERDCRFPFGHQGPAELRAGDDATG